MGDLGEKQVVSDVTVGDVVMSIVDAPAVLSVDGLHGRRCEVKVGVVKRLTRTSPPRRCSEVTDTGKTGEEGSVTNSTGRERAMEVFAVATFELLQLQRKNKIAAEPR